MISYWQNISNVGHTLTIGNTVYMGLSDAELMKMIRDALGLTQWEMAEKLGYNSQTVISMIENGRRNLSGVARSYLEYIEANELNNN